MKVNVIWTGKLVEYGMIKTVDHVEPLNVRNICKECEIPLEIISMEAKKVQIYYRCNILTFTHKNNTMYIHCEPVSKDWDCEVIQDWVNASKRNAELIKRVQAWIKNLKLKPKYLVTTKNNAIYKDPKNNNLLVFSLDDKGGLLIEKKELAGA